MKHKVSTLEGALLDAAVAQALGHRPFFGAPRDEQDIPSSFHEPQWRFQNGWPVWRYGSEWVYGGPIIERERITTYPGAIDTGNWFAHTDPRGMHWSGPTPLIAAMRAYVASKFGAEVDLP